MINTFELAHFKITLKGLVKNHRSIYASLKYELDLHDVIEEKVRKKYVKELQSLLQEGFAGMDVVGSVTLSCYTSKWNDNKNEDVFARQLTKHVYNRDPLYPPYVGTVYILNADNTNTIVIPAPQVIPAIWQDIEYILQSIVS